MEYLTHSLIEKSDALEIVQKLKVEKSSWQDGKKTAGSHAAKIKKNFQLNKKSKVSIELKDLVINKIISNPLLKSFTLPRLIHGVMFSNPWLEMAMVFILIIHTCPKEEAIYLLPYF